MDDNIRKRPRFQYFLIRGTPPGKFTDDLLQAANLKQWNRLQRLLDENRTFDTTRDSRTLQVVLRAAESGQLAAVEEMFRRKFRFAGSGEGSDLVGRLAKDGGDTAMAVIGFLVKNSYARRNRPCSPPPAKARMH